MTQIGAPLLIRGSTANCALPANTTSDMKTITPTGKPLLPMATPVTKPQAAMPMAVPSMSRAPLANSGWRQMGVAAVAALVTARIVAARACRYLRFTLPLPATELLTTALPV